MKAMMLLLYAVSCMCCSGQLNATRSQVEQFLGNPVSKTTEAGFEAAIYKPEGWAYKVWYKQDRCKKILIQTEHKEQLTQEELNLIMDEASDGFAWVLLGTFDNVTRWDRSDGSRAELHDGKVFIARSKSSTIGAVHNSNTEAQAPIKRDYSDVVAKVQNAGNALKVTNISGWRWTKVRICINPGFFNDGYYYDFPAINNNVSREVLYRNFADKKGNRFDLNKHVIRDIKIELKDPNGLLQFYNCEFK